MAKDTGIIFLDVSRSINEKIKKKSPIKIMSLFFIGLMVFTAFSMVTFITQPANASPPLTGDKAFSNASLFTPYTQTQTGSNPSFNLTIPTHGVINVKANTIKKRDISLIGGFVLIFSLMLLETSKKIMPVSSAIHKHLNNGSDGSERTNSEYDMAIQLFHKCIRYIQ